MKSLCILKLGSTWPATADRLGDFDAWTAKGLAATAIDITVIDVEHGAPLPAHTECAGAVLTGSHSMVTENLPWSVATEAWLRDALDRQLPVLGVCYGHQLLARAAGGRVDYHPRGREIGTVAIRTSPARSRDPLFHEAPEEFLAHATHAQSVLELPPGATHLAASDWDANHAFRTGACAWGVQFHPEYTAAIMRAYIDGLRASLEGAGRDVERIDSEVADTPYAAAILQRFGEFVAAQSPRG